MATGKSAWAPSQGSLPNDSAGSCQDVEDDEKEPFIDLESDPQNVYSKVFDLNDDNFSFDKDTQSRRRKRNNPPPEARRSTSSSTNLFKALDRICDICEVLANKSYTPPEPPVTIKDCMKILNEMEDEVSKGSGLYLFTCRLFYKQEHKDMFKELDPSIRFTWIQNEEDEANKK